MPDRDEGRAPDGRRETGRAGEDAAEAFLRSHGCEVLDRNWRIREGELDLVVRAPGGEVRFVEVRTRSGRGFGSGAESVTRDKRRRLRRLACAWLDAHRDLPPAPVYFDVASVLAEPGAEPRIDYLPGAF